MSVREQKRKWPWPLLWIALIFLTSSSVLTTDDLTRAVTTIAPQVKEQEFRTFWLAAWWIFVKGWHAIEFGVLYLLARRWLGRTSPWPFVITGAYAILDEFHQVFVPDRGGRWSDVCIDLLGILGAWLIVEWRRKRRNEASALPKGLQSPWVLTLVLVGMFALVFQFSIVPFGLVTWGRGGNPFAP